MKKQIVAAALAVACLVVPPAAQTQAIHGAHAAAPAHVTLEEWSERIGTALGRTLRYPVLINGQPFAYGVVEVKFNCSDTGKPDKVALHKSSGSAALDRAAIAGVSRIISLHPLPTGLGHDQQYRALIVFDDDEGRYRRQMAAMRDSAAEANKWFKGPPATAMRVGPIAVAAR